MCATRFTLLSALHLAGPRPIGDLAALLSADRTTLTRNLAVAERHGLVTLRADGDDARSRVASITPKGARTLIAALPVWRKTQQRLGEAIGDEVAASLRKLAGGPCVTTPGTPLPSQHASRKPLSKPRRADRQSTGHPKHRKETER